MQIRWVRLGVAAFFLLYLVAVTWPVATVFGRSEPLVLGLPFSFFWPALWIAMGGVALALLDRAEDEARRQRGGSGDDARDRAEGPP